MKKLFSLLLIVAFALASMPQLAADDNPQVEKTQEQYQQMVYALEPGAPITFFIPPAIKEKLKAICCAPPGSCQNYCCWYSPSGCK